MEISPYIPRGGNHAEPVQLRTGSVDAAATAYVSSRIIHRPFAIIGAEVLAYSPYTSDPLRFRLGVGLAAPTTEPEFNALELITGESHGDGADADTRRIAVFGQAMMLGFLGYVTWQSGQRITMEVQNADSVANRIAILLWVTVGEEGMRQFGITDPYDGLPPSGGGRSTGPSPQTPTPP